MRILVTAAIALIVAESSQSKACCQLGGTACGDPFAVSCNNGVVCFPPYRSCPSCTCTTTMAGHTCLANSSEPGTVATLFLDKSATTAGNLDLRWTASCTGSGPDYSIHEGQLGVWFSHEPVVCTTGFALTATIAPLDGNRYYLVAPIFADFTGGFGVDSTGAERPDGSPSCTNDRAVVPCP